MSTHRADRAPSAPDETTVNFAAINGVQLAYTVEGSGEPVVWVSGTGLGSALWRRWQTPAFRETNLCVTFDLRGSGASEAPEEPYSIRLFAEDTLGLLDHLSIPRAHFVGSSLGSAVLQELALMAPERVESLVLIATWSSTRQQHCVRRWLEARLDALQHAPRQTYERFSYFMWSLTTVDSHPDLIDEYQAFLRANAASQPLHAHLNHYKADLEHETESRLHRIAAPSLVLFGEEDLITIPKYNLQVARALTASQYRPIPRAGHLVRVEQSAEVNADIQRFYQSLGR